MAIQEEMSNSYCMNQKLGNIGARDIQLDVIGGWMVFEATDLIQLPG
jgi:hypothetical protein